MNALNLLVIGDKNTVSLFRLLGAKGVVVSHIDEMQIALDYIESHENTIGGILISGDLYDEESRALKKIRSKDISTIFLASKAKGADAGHKSLEDLMEKALGMKISI